MKMISVSEKDFDMLFEACLDKLKLDRFYGAGAGLTNKEDQFANSPVGQMHGKFHYEIVSLKEKLKNQ